MSGKATPLDERFDRAERDDLADTFTALARRLWGLDRVAVGGGRGDHLAEVPASRAWDAATPEQVDLVFGLTALRAAISEMSQNAMCGVLVAGNEWAVLAGLLGRSARLCRQQVVLDGDVEGVAGG